ncbi:MAG: GNAT family N-acetyltransferase [Thermonemataceae bacterium]|nr:GNAT family N-acetyltransferase [Thermonemataceae bacterium]
MIHFREATETDIPLIGELARKIWCEWYISIINQDQIDYMLERMYSPESLKEQMTKKNSRFSLAYLDNRLVAYASVQNEGGKSYFLDKFYVDTQKHKQNIGSQFFAYLEDIYQPEVIRLRVNRRNFIAINFYFKNGFKIEKVDDLQIGNSYTMDDFIMKKTF